MTLSLYLVPFSRYSTSKFLGFDLDLWPLGSPEVKNIATIWKLIYNFLSNFYWHFLSLSRTVFEIFDFKAHACMTSYLTSIDNFSLSRTHFEIFDFKVFRAWPWPLTFRSHLKSKIFQLFESPYMTFYLTSIHVFFLYRTVFEIFDFKVFRVWPWPLSFRAHPRSKIFSSIESPYKTSYLTSIDTFSLYLVPFSRYSTSKFLGFDLDLWPLGVTWGQKYFIYSEAHIWLPILLLLTLSLYLVPFSRYSTSKFLGFDSDLCPLRVTRGQKYFHHSKAHIRLPI